MENKQPILSICILTYNREKYLKESLETIISQDGFNEQDIEIIISDNASTDNTKQLAKEFETKYSNIKYYKNIKNIGSEKNVIEALKHGTGKYLWTFGDDDLQEKGLITKIVGVIKNNYPDFIICNFNKFIGEKDNKTITYENVLKIKDDLFFSNKKDFFDYLYKNNDPFFILSNNYFIHLSIKIVKGDLYKKNVFPQNQIFFFNNNNGSVYVISDELISYRTDNYNISGDILFVPYSYDEAMTEFYKNLFINNKKYICNDFKNSISAWLNKILNNEYKLYLMSISIKQYKLDKRLLELNSKIDLLNKESGLSINKINSNVYILLMKYFLIIPISLRRFLYTRLAKLYIFLKFKYAKIKGIT